MTDDAVFCHIDRVVHCVVWFVMTIGRRRPSMPLLAISGLWKLTLKTMGAHTTWLVVAATVAMSAAASTDTLVCMCPLIDHSPNTALVQRFSHCRSTSESPHGCNDRGREDGPAGDRLCQSRSCHSKAPSTEVHALPCPITTTATAADDTAPTMHGSICY